MLKALSRSPQEGVVCCLFDFNAYRDLLELVVFALEALQDRTLMISLVRRPDAEPFVKAALHPLVVLKEVPSKHA